MPNGREDGPPGRAGYVSIVFKKAGGILYPMTRPFTHLHTHSHFSLLNALPNAKELVSEAKKDGMKALALTDNGAMYGVIDFYDKCRAEEIKPIIGVDFYMAARTRRDKEARVDSRRTRLVLLAKGVEGYQNLIKLVTFSHLEGFYYRPRIDYELLKKYSKDLVCISPSFNSDIANAVELANESKAKEHADFFKEQFGDDFYIEITHHPEIDGHEEKMKKLQEFAKKESIKIVAAHDVYYIKPEDREARKTLLSISNTFGGGGNYSEDENFSFINTKTANKFFKETPEALDATQEIVDKCNLEIPMKWKFPDFKIERGLSPDEELREKAIEGIPWREMKDTPELRKRIDYELGIIKDKGYAKYFLAVADLLHFAREQKIQSNTRGSAAGSLVSYLTGITIVDPIELNLPFERFLNPERPSAPDIDMDFADARRDEVIEYTRRKYGKEHVAQIGTFGTMMARGSVRDTARALGYDYEIGDKIAKLIPMGSQGFPMTIDRAMDEEPDLKKLYKEDEDAKKIIDMAKKIEGRARHIGVHAAGVVISPDPLTDDVPLQYDPKGGEKLITQYDMYSVGEDGVGLLKFDFLGLKNLSIMDRTISLVEKLYNEEINVDHIPLDDKKTYEMLSRGETEATFQLNGDGMTRFLKELKPTNINDINAMVALYRPGPMAFIPDYIERKHNPDKVKYLDDRFKEILEPTFGILMYQDDVMMIAVKFAGYSWGQADKFRKAMGKKIPELMAEQKIKFTEGCMKVGGLSEKQTKALWESIETFAAYGFNKAHAASYGRISYLTSYLKANYPSLYMSSVLTADSGDVDKIAVMVEECKRMGIDVLPPDINESFSEFAAIPEDPTSPKTSKGKEKIRFGLTTIKNFGEGISKAITQDRKVNGKFKSLENFLTRIIDRNMNRKSLEALIKAGALDSLEDRATMLHNLDALLQFNKDVSKGDKDQDSLFGNSGDVSHLHLEPSEPIPVDQKLAWEKEFLGLYISGNPLEQYREFLEKRGESIQKVKKEKSLGVSHIIAGLVEDVREINTKKGDRMAFVKVQDFDDEIECVFFPSVYETYRQMLQDEKVVAIKGKLNERNGELSILVDKMKKLSDK
jgi:DNA polymerase-3 subunit alpha